MNLKFAAVAALLLTTAACATQQPAGTMAPAPTPPPVAQAPAVPIQRNFLVFFEFAKSDVTPEANRVIIQAADSAKAGNVTRINVTGHADRAGSAAYNQALSRRRASAVMDALVRRGISRNQIFVFARGESQPLVATRDGVREAQNRRVEIVLQ